MEIGCVDEAGGRLKLKHFLFNPSTGIEIATELLLGGPILARKFGYLHLYFASKASLI